MDDGYLLSLSNANEMIIIELRFLTTDGEESVNDGRVTVSVVAAHRNAKREHY
jgi:hypothetical protein